MTKNEEAISYFSNCKNAVKENKVIDAKNNLRKFLHLCGKEAQQAKPASKAILEKILNYYYQAYIILDKGIINTELKDIFHIASKDINTFIEKDEDIRIDDIVEKDNIETEDQLSEDLVEEKEEAISEELPIIDDDCSSGPLEITTDSNTNNISEEKEEIIEKIDNPCGFEPQTFDEFVGQDKIKKLLKDAIKYTKLAGGTCICNKGGVLFLGPKGLGKTTLMHILAKEMGIPEESIFIIEPAMLKNDVKSQKIVEAKLDAFARKGKTEPVVLIADEIHRFNDAQQSMFLTLMQSRKYINQTENCDVEIAIPEFTIIGATTDEYKLLDTIYNRFEKGLICRLEEYSEGDLRKIVLQKVNSFANEFPVEITNEAVSEIVKRNRGTIREIESVVDKLHQKAVLLGKKTIDKNLTDELFKELDIDESGLTSKDIEILNTLNSANNKTLSEENLCSMVNLKAEIFSEMYKPYLIKRKLIVTTGKGQSLSNAGIAYLEDKANKKKYDANVDNNLSQPIYKDDNEVATSNQSLEKESVKNKNVLDLLTGKFAKQIVEKSVLCKELNMDETTLTEELNKLYLEHLVNIRPNGFIATLEGYKRLNKAFPM